MEYRNLGRTGVKVSPLCLGAWQFGNRTPKENAFMMIDHAIEAGSNFIDTANVYGRGLSETILGEALQRHINQDKLVIATKFHGRMDDDDPNAAGPSRRHIIAACEDSLRRISTCTSFTRPTPTFLLTKACGPWMIWSGPVRSAIPEPAISPSGRS